MRRIFVLLITSMLTLMSVPVNAQTEKGDLNADGNIDKVDVANLIHIILGLAEGTDAYDVNNDGKVDITDVTCLIGIIASKHQESSLLLSENAVDLFVNSSTNVIIEMGNGEYELRNDKTDIFDAELVMANKDDAPETKDIIRIYGISEGTDQLEIVDIKSNETTTITVNVKLFTDEDDEEVDRHITTISGFINQQHNISIGEFQDNLLSWIEKQDWVKQASLSPDKNQIDLTFENGTSSMLIFQDISFFDEPEETENVRIFAPWKTDAEEEKYFDVTYQEGEELIESPNVLFAQCSQMYSEPEDHHWYDDDWWTSNASQEKTEVEKNIENSPINLKEYYARKDLKFLGYDWKDFGMILVTQTHGLADSRGGFLVDDAPCSTDLANKAIIIYIKDGHIFEAYNGEKQKVISYVKAFVPAHKLADSKAVYLGNYCYSYGLSNLMVKRPLCIIYGNTERSSYGYNFKVINKFTMEMFSGMTVTDSYNHVQDENYFDFYRISNKPQINRQSKQRYFSIKTILVTPSNMQTQWTCLGGYVNGINNLKKEDIIFKMWYSDHPFEVPSEELDNYQITVGDGIGYQYGVSFYDRWDISTDGKILRIFKYFPLSSRTNQKKLYHCFGFEYKGKIYHGDVRELTY